MASGASRSQASPTRLTWFDTPSEPPLGDLGPTVCLAAVGAEGLRRGSGRAITLELRSGGVGRSGVVSASACGSGCGTRLLMETQAIYQHVALDGDLEAKYQATMKQIEL
jgi:hypothetical protein